MILAGKELSYYALKDINEFIAEALAEYLSENLRVIAQKVFDIIMEI